MWKKQMAEEEKLRGMVANFPVSHLRELLSHAGQSTSGDEAQLRTRALDLVRRRCPHYGVRIRALNASLSPPPPLHAPAPRPPPPRHAPAPAPRPRLLPPCAPEPGPLLLLPPPTPLHAPAPRLSSIPLHAIAHHRLVRTHPAAHSTQRRGPHPMLLHQNQPSRAFRRAQNMMVPAHPAIRMRDLTFFDHVDVLVRMTSLPMFSESLVQQNSNRIQTQRLSFSMTQKQLVEVANSVRRKDGIFQAQLRICNLDVRRIYDDAFPPYLMVKVNGNIVYLTPAPSTTAGPAPESTPGPIDITRFIKMTSSAVNDVIMSWSAELRARYAVVINLVRHLQVSELVERLQDRCLTSPMNTVSRIRRLLDGDHLDIAPASNTLTVSLCCPVSRALIKVPCRGARCNHIQCFDGSTYLQMNERRPTWRCPVCDKPARYSSLEVDGYFTAVLADPNRRDCQEIRLHRDGAWSRVMKEETMAVTLPADGECEFVTTSSSEKDDSDDDNDDDDDDDDIVDENDVDRHMYIHHTVVIGGNNACGGEVNQVTGTTIDHQGAMTSTSNGTDDYHGPSTSSGIRHRAPEVIDLTFSDSDSD